MLDGQTITKQNVRFQGRTHPDIFFTLIVYKLCLEGSVIPLISHPQEVLLAQFSLYVHKSGLKPDSFHFIYYKTKCEVQGRMHYRQNSTWSNSKWPTLLKYKIEVIVILDWLIASTRPQEIFIRGLSRPKDLSVKFWDWSRLWSRSGLWSGSRWIVWNFYQSCVSDRRQSGSRWRWFISMQVCSVWLSSSYSSYTSLLTPNCLATWFLTQSRTTNNTTVTQNLFNQILIRSGSACIVLLYLRC